MTKRHIPLLALPALLAAALLFYMPEALFADTDAAPVAAASSQKEGDAAATLFPGFDASLVTAVTLTTPQVNFDLRRMSDRRVSVNGQRGDREVFVTLLEQIASMTISPIEPFRPQGTPLLTLVIRGQDTQYTAEFYNDGGTGEYARVISRAQSSPVYGETDAWRVGTLMLTCEGMRVQDAHGQETPLE